MNKSSNIDNNHYAIKLSQQLISQQSFSGYHQEIIEFIAKILDEHKFQSDIVSFDGDNSYKVNNLHSIFKPKLENKANDKILTLYFAGHTDVVAVGDENLWLYNPFDATINDDKLFGRGAVDMKCAIACFIVAAIDFLKMHNYRINFAIGFMITNDEEADSINGTSKLLEWMREKSLNIDYCLVGEPTNPNKFGEMIKIGRRGSINFSLEINGKQGHVAYPENAINPNKIIIDILQILQKHRFDDGNEFFSPTNLEITYINSDNFGNNVIPNNAKANFNIRFNDYHCSQNIIDLVDFVCKKNIIAMNADYKLKYRISGESFLSKPDILANLVKDATFEASNINPIFSTTGGTSDARFIKNYAKQVVEIGLVNKTAHQINEYAEITEILQLYKTYSLILQKFNNINNKINVSI